MMLHLLAEKERTLLKKNVLILCTGNSCRSQMAEGLINARLGDYYQAFSAGTKPSGYVHPGAIQSLAELGIDLSQNRSKSVDFFQGRYFDYVITVCGSAEADCPLWLSSAGHRLHMGFDDPAAFRGSEAEIRAGFNRIRNEIADRLLSFLQTELTSGGKTMSGIRTEFEHGLEKLQEDLLILGSMVNTAIDLSIQALKNRDQKLARQVIADDEQINRLRYQIEADCLGLIARQQPVAHDLRTIIAVINIILELERMGDHAAGIAKIAVEMGEHPPLKPLIDLPRMAVICQKMVSESLESFIREKKKLAKKVIKTDDEIDQLYQQIVRELLSFMMEDPHSISRGMYLLFVAHNLERIGDRATNICERALFRVTGKIKETPSGPGVVMLDDPADNDDSETVLDSILLENKLDDFSADEANESNESAEA